MDFMEGHDELPKNVEKKSGEREIISERKELVRDFGKAILFVTAIVAAGFAGKTAKDFLDIQETDPTISLPDRIDKMRQETTDTGEERGALFVVKMGENVPSEVQYVKGTDNGVTFHLDALFHSPEEEALQKAKKIIQIHTHPKSAWHEISPPGDGDFVGYTRWAFQYKGKIEFIVLDAKGKWNITVDEESKSQKALNMLYEEARGALSMRDISVEEMKTLLPYVNNSRGDIEWVYNMYPDFRSKTLEKLDESLNTPEGIYSFLALVDMGDLRIEASRIGISAKDQEKFINMFLEKARTIGYNITYTLDLKAKSQQ
jgi:hypothetical protein